jgi:uncharacterized tellurite resistance protein B-like protein
MRTYPIDSPEAAARLLAMTLVADGQYSMSEIKTLDRLGAPQRLGLSPEALKGVIDGFCEDLLLASNGQWVGSIHLDDGIRRQMMAEVKDPDLQETVWRLCEAVALADGHLADGEVELLDRMAFAWRQPAMALSSTS